MASEHAVLASLSPQQQQQVRQLFAECEERWDESDTLPPGCSSGDGKGYVGVRGLRRVAPGLNDEQLESLLYSLDLDGDGVVRFSDWVHACSQWLLEGPPTPAASAGASSAPSSAATARDASSLSARDASSAPAQSEEYALENDALSMKLGVLREQVEEQHALNSDLELKLAESEKLLKDIRQQLETEQRTSALYRGEVEASQQRSEELEKEKEMVEETLKAMRTELSELHEESHRVKTQAQLAAEEAADAREALERGKCVRTRLADRVRELEEEQRRWIQEVSIAEHRASSIQQESRVQIEALQAAIEDLQRQKECLEETLKSHEGERATARGEVPEEGITSAGLMVESGAEVSLFDELGFEESFPSHVVDGDESVLSLDAELGSGLDDATPSPSFIGEQVIDLMPADEQIDGENTTGDSPLRADEGEWAIIDGERSAFATECRKLRAQVTSLQEELGSTEAKLQDVGKRSSSRIAELERLLQDAARAGEHLKLELAASEEKCDQMGQTLAEVSSARDQAVQQAASSAQRCAKVEREAESQERSLVAARESLKAVERQLSEEEQVSTKWRKSAEEALRASEDVSARLDTSTREQAMLKKELEETKAALQRAVDERAQLLTAHRVREEELLQGASTESGKVQELRTELSRLLEKMRHEAQEKQKLRSGYVASVEKLRAQHRASCERYNAQLGKWKEAYDNVVAQAEQLRARLIESNQALGAKRKSSTPEPAPEKPTNDAFSAMRSALHQKPQQRGGERNLYSMFAQKVFIPRKEKVLSFEERQRRDAANRELEKQLEETRQRLQYGMKKVTPLFQPSPEGWK